MADYGLTISVHDTTNTGPGIPGAEVTGELVPAHADSNGNAEVNTVLITVRAKGYYPYERQPYYKPNVQAPVIISLQPQVAPPFPPVPSREQILTAQWTFQGLRVDLPETGPNTPWFGPAIAWLSPESRQRVYTMKRAVGDKVCEVAISGQYNAPAPNVYANLPGRDFTKDLNSLVELLTEIVTEGFYVRLFLAGDGESNPSGGYNDPGGMTYGFQAMMGYLPAVVAAVTNAGLLPYTVFVPGFDGVFAPVPGTWSPNQLNQYLLAIRALIGPLGYSEVEFGTPYVHWGDGKANYDSAAGQALDSILIEGTLRVQQNDTLWQPAARVLGPAYRRGATQPAWDDPGAPYAANSPVYYLGSGTPRGPFYVRYFEFDTYYDVRNQVSPQQVEQDRNVARSVGYTLLG